MPQNTELKTTTVISDAEAWRLMYVGPIDDDGRVDKYAKRLKDAGFTVERPSDVNVSGTDGTWQVDAVIRPPVITFQVMKVG